MSNFALPFLTTHRVNIATNLQLGLVFLLSGPQKTNGLSSISAESLISDQLAVAESMILNWLGNREEDPQELTPWVEVPMWHATEGFTSPDPSEVAMFEEALVQIRCESSELSDKLWDMENQDSRRFFIRLITQMNECVRFTHRRMRAMQVCIRLIDLGKEPDHDELLEAFMSAGMELYMEIDSAYRSGYALGSQGMPLYACNGIESDLPAARLFSRDLLQVVRDLLTPEALRRGYTNLDIGTR